MALAFGPPRSYPEYEVGTGFSPNGECSMHGKNARFALVSTGLFAGAVLAVFLAPPSHQRARAADSEKIKASVSAAVDFLKKNALGQNHVGGGGAGAPGVPPPMNPGGAGPGNPAVGGANGPEEGPAVLAGIALLEANVPPS